MPDPNSPTQRVSRPAISVVVPTYNRIDQTKLCLANLVVAIDRYGHGDLTVVDNGSTDGTWEWLTGELKDRSQLIQHPGVTISALRNLGASQTNAEYISFVDSDCLVPADYYENVVDVFANVRADVVGCMYGMPDDVHWIEKTWMLLNCPLRDGYASLLPGGSMVIRRAAFERVAGFNESLITGEDAELCQRLLTAGYRIYESRRLRLVHLRNMNTLTGFFRKQAWQGIGMFGTVRAWRLDQPAIMTFAHLILSLGAIGWLIAGSGPMLTRLGIALLLVLSVPSITVAYKVLARGGSFLPARSVVLYSLYYYARIWAMLRVATGAKQ